MGSIRSFFGCGVCPVTVENLYCSWDESAAFFGCLTCPGTGPDFGGLFAPAPSFLGPQFETLAVLGSAHEQWEN